VTKLFTLTTPTAIATLTGADGLAFDPNDGTFSTLLVGEQDSNRVGRLKTNGTGLVEVNADGTTHCNTPFECGQAFYVIPSPDNSKLFALPNDIGFIPTIGGPAYGSANVNVVPLAPFGAAGTPHTVTGPDTFIVGLAFLGNTVNPGYYGTALDQGTGNFGQLDTTAFTTQQSTIVDDTGGGAGQGSLPSHGLAYDSYSNCFFLSGGDLTWQLCPDTSVSNKFHIVVHCGCGQHSSGRPAHLQCG